MRKFILKISVIAAALLLGAGWVQAQDNSDAIQNLSRAELKELVGPIALYPDDLVAVVLPSSAYPLQLVQAQRLLDDDGQPDTEWDESVVAVMNYPEIVEFLNEDLDWTYSLGLAFINQEQGTFDAIQAFRSDALAAGNLKSDNYQVVRVDDGIIRIEPRSQQEVYVPYYEPQQVIVRQVMPVYYYYPVARPIYYYPYPAHYAFGVSHFYGVGTYFSIGWQYRGLSLHYSTGSGHPYAGHYYSPRHYYFKPRVRPHYYAGKQHHYKPRHLNSPRHKVRHNVRQPRRHANAKVWQPRHQPAVAKRRSATAKHNLKQRSVATRQATGHKKVTSRKVAQRHTRSAPKRGKATPNEVRRDKRQKVARSKPRQQQAKGQMTKRQTSKNRTAKNQPAQTRPMKKSNRGRSESRRSENRRSENKASGRRMASSNNRNNNRLSGNSMR